MVISKQRTGGILLPNFQKQVSEIDLNDESISKSQVEAKWIARFATRFHDDLTLLCDLNPSSSARENINIVKGSSPFLLICLAIGLNSLLDPLYLQPALSAPIA